MNMQQTFVKLFEPEKIAFIGASQNITKWGYNILHNLIRGRFDGDIYPINPQGGTWYGRKVYKDIDNVPDKIDLAVIVVRRDIMVETIKKCVRKEIPVGIIITAGFSETGLEGSIIEREVVEIAREGGMRLVGPNTMGVLSAYPSWMHATMSSSPHELKGNVAVVAQSGNLGGSITYRFLRRGIGISRLISSGNEADLNVEDYLELLEMDPHTNLIVLYIEGVRDGRRFIDTAKRLTKKKPILLLKGGCTPSGAKAAMSHTGAIAGNDEVFKALCHQTGIIQLNTMDEIIDLAGILLCQPRLKGNRIGIVTLGGGWGVIATDLCANNGLEVVPLGDENINKLDGILPLHWSRANPIDLVAGYSMTAIRDCIKILVEHNSIDIVMVLGIGYPTMRVVRWRESPITPKSDVERTGGMMISNELEVLNFIIEQIKKNNKPVVPVMDLSVFEIMMDDNPVKYLERNGVMPYSCPDRAVFAVGRAVNYYKSIEWS